jgi:hypothetical protein
VQREIEIHAKLDHPHVVQFVSLPACEVRTSAPAHLSPLAPTQQFGWNMPLPCGMHGCLSTRPRLCGRQYMALCPTPTCLSLVQCTRHPTQVVNCSAGTDSRHACAVQYAAFEDERHMYLVMEFASGVRHSRHLAFLTAQLLLASFGRLTQLLPVWTSSL